MRHEPTYKGMTPPLTQNLKTLGLWVFFLICCSTFSFLPDVGLRFTLEYLTITPSSEGPSSTLKHSPSSGSILKPEYIIHDPSLVPPFTHLYGTRLPETSIRKTFDRPSRKPMALIPLAGRIRGGKPRRSQTMRTEPNSCKRMTLPSTQNLKAVGLCESSYLYITQLSHSYPM